MRGLGSSGIWELFVPGVGDGALYKFEIKAQSGDLRVKTDPMAKRIRELEAALLEEQQKAEGDALQKRVLSFPDPNASNFFTTTSSSSSFFK